MWYVNLDGTPGYGYNSDSFILTMWYVNGKNNAKENFYEWVLY